ncbi:hypothetical protein TKK_0013235 [Trichogramma kaykai]
MESNGTINYAAKVKEEPEDMSLHEDDDYRIDDDTFDTKSFQDESARILKRSQETHEIQSNPEIEIEIECVDVKSIVNSSVPKRLDNWTKNHLLDIQEGSGFEAKDKIKLEPDDAMKEEFSYDDIDKDISKDCEINGQNIKIDPQESAKISEKSIEALTEVSEKSNLHAFELDLFLSRKIHVYS